MILYRYIIKEHLFPFLASLSIIVFYFVMQEAVLRLDQIISKGLDPGVVLEVFLIQLGWIITLAIPMAILTATLWVFGRMSGDNEITSIKASGQSMFPLLLPVLTAAAVITVLLVFFNDLILPDANHRALNLLSDISRKRPAAFIEPKVLIRDFPGYTLYAENVDPRTGDLNRVRIFCDQPGQDPSSTVAGSGIIRMTPDQQYLELTLFNGETHSISRRNFQDYFLCRFAQQVVFIKNIDTKFERTNSSYRGNREMSSQMMLEEVGRLKADNAAGLSDYCRAIDTLLKQVKGLDSLQKAVPGSIRPGNPVPPGTFLQWASSLPMARSSQVKVQRTKELADIAVRRIRSNRSIISQLMIEVHKKVAIPIACLLFVLIGAPLGIMARRGGLTVGASYSIFFFIAYWVFLIWGEDLGDKMILSPEMAMWGGNLIIALCGVILIMLMLRETTFRFDAVLAFFKKAAGVKIPFIKRPAGTRRGLVPAALFKGPKWILKRSIGTLPMYLVSLFAGYVVGVLLSLVVIFVVIDYISNLSRFERADFTEIALFYWYYLPWIIQIIIPIVLLLASMFSMGKLAKHSELIAMKASGVGIRQLTMPLLILGFLLSIGAFYAGEWLIPKSNSLRNELTAGFNEPRNSAMRRHHNKPDKNSLSEFRRNFYYFGNKTTMYMFQEFGTRPQTARGVWRETFDTSSIRERIQAERMIFDSTGWRFVKGTTRSFSVDGSMVTPFDTLRDTILKALPIDMVAQIKSPEEMSYWELESYIDASRRRGELVQKYEGELEFKKALPWMNFIVILFGIAITARAGRKGSAVLFGIGLMMTFTYWLIARFAIVFAQNGHLPTLVGAWIGNALFLVLGLILYRKASQ